MSAWPHPYPQNAGLYRAIDSFQHPWIPSPAQPFVNPELPRSVREGSKELEKSKARRKNRKQCVLARRLRSLVRKKGNVVEDQTGHKEDLSAGRVILPSEWKAYGNWAFPTVNGVQVNNAAPPIVPPIHVEPDVLWRSLWGPRGSPHPERWIPRFEHPSMPPRPSAWSTPIPGKPLPFPWECQLNPFLEHRSIGLTPLTFDISLTPDAIIWGEPDGVIPIFPQDRGQPATYPFLTHMHISGVADDMEPHFLWPFMVANASGIVCQDMFEAICDNFHEHVTQEEYDGLSAQRREQVARAYYARVRSSANTSRDDGLRRIDYLGDRMMFRGLEASPKKDGSWIMFVGPP